MEVFEVKCLNCGKKVVISTGENLDNSQIKFEGQAEALFNPDVYISCNCGNQISIDNG